MTSVVLRGWRRDAAVVFVIALIARLAAVEWAATRFAPAADGAYYHQLALRLAEGQGYTWRWPDGVVTYAAHYPVGYPGAIAALYAVAGPHPVAAMMLNAVLGSFAALAVHRLAAHATPHRAIAFLAGALVAVHPGLVAYTPALMTEGVTGALLACAGWAVARAAQHPAPSRTPIPFVIVGLVLGVATLMRPQALLLAPVFGWIAARRPGASEVMEASQGTSQSVSAQPRLAPVTRSAWRAMASHALPMLVVTMTALAVCMPWTVRNCERMGRCALVSMNGGWNLLIGTDPEARGAWAPLQVPDGCREIFDEAGKDACFAQEARRKILQHPVEWLGLIPQKLGATLNYCGAAGWYLREANPEEFSEKSKIALGVVETIYERGVLLLCLVWAARQGVSKRSRWSQVVTGALLIVGVMATLHVQAWVGYVSLLGMSLMRGSVLRRASVLPLVTLSVLAATLLTHAAFFGAGRYALVTFPLLSGLAALGMKRGQAGDETIGHRLVLPPS
ncbi:glycosyltransferase family 39 protein [Chondromyces crocatus]|uniref:Glycosyltransferase RgtA/B/C/D-like domain-containing protein n=1 Tax=Chondromyces crocatus TaxID=52 RepID=A0A0K1ERD2_CHOCO|nr:glycosyltransferase family 39 protein [Chondromyces crocatus]AKT43207.1 uncharacterized protein CMC5_074380 [Chondromyces crocatus]